MVAGRDLTLAGELPMQFAGDGLDSCTVETCVVLLTSVTPINAMKKKFDILKNNKAGIPVKIEKKKKCSQFNFSHEKNPVHFIR